MTFSVNLRADAEAEAARIRTTRRSRSATPLILGRPLLTTLRRRLRTPLEHIDAVVILRAHIADGSGRLLEELLVPVGMETRRIGGAGLQPCLQRARTAALAAIAARVSTIASTHARALTAWRERERAIAEHMRLDQSRMVQPGLFARNDWSVEAADRCSDHDRTRERTLEGAASLVVAQSAEIVMVLCCAD